MHSVWLHQEKKIRCYFGWLLCPWSFFVAVAVGWLGEMLGLDLILRACDSAGWGMASGNCRLLCLSLSKGSFIKTEFCSKLNSPFGAWLYCPWCEIQRNTRASRGLGNKRECKSVTKIDAVFIPRTSQNISQETQQALARGQIPTTSTRIGTCIGKPGMVLSNVQSASWFQSSTLLNNSSEWTSSSKHTCQNNVSACKKIVLWNIYESGNTNQKAYLLFCINLW